MNEDNIIMTTEDIARAKMFISQITASIPPSEHPERYIPSCTGAIILMLYDVNNTLERIAEALEGQEKK